MARNYLLDSVASRVSSLKSSHTIRVAIDGVDAAGKTTLADELADRLRQLGRLVVRSGIDGFHRPRQDRYARGFDCPEGYYHDSFNLDGLVETLLRPLGPGGTGYYRTAIFDYRKEMPVESPKTKVGPEAILLFDGIFLLRPELRSFWEYTIFVRAQFDETLRRALVRDLALWADAKKIEQRYLSRYIPGQKLYLAECNPEKNADLVIDNNDPSNPFVARSLIN
jgi:uridine kinase